MQTDSLPSCKIKSSLPSQHMPKSTTSTDRVSDALAAITRAADALFKHTNKAVSIQKSTRASLIRSSTINNSFNTHESQSSLSGYRQIAIHLNKSAQIRSEILSSYPLRIVIPKHSIVIVPPHRQHHLKIRSYSYMHV